MVPRPSPIAARRGHLARRCRFFRARPIDRLISASGAYTTRISIAAVVVAADDYWRYIRLRSDAHIVARQNAIAIAIGTCGCGQEHESENRLRSLLPLFADASHSRIGALQAPFAHCRPVAQASLQHSSAHFARVGSSSFCSLRRGVRAARAVSGIPVVVVLIL